MLSMCPELSAVWFAFNRVVPGNEFLAIVQGSVYM